MVLNKKFDLTNKTIIITGSAGLLGSEYVLGLSEAGANVVLADLNIEKSKKLENIIKKKYNTTPLSIKVDVTNPKSIQNLIKKTLKKFKKIDVLVNNAILSEQGKFKKIKFENYPLSLWNQVIDVNLTGTFLCCQEIGKIMKQQKNGIIINISSIYGINGADQRIYANSGIIKSAVYSVTKAAMINFTRYLAAYWNRSGIRVNTLSLGGVEEDQDKIFKQNYNVNTILGRMAKKNEYVAALIFLSSDASSYMTGSNLVIDGGWTSW